MDLKVTELPSAGETFTASRGPFKVEGHEEAAASVSCVVSLPFWTARESLKVFTALYLDAAKKAPEELLRSLISHHSPFSEVTLVEEGKGGALEHWALVPGKLQELESDEKRRELQTAVEQKRSVLFLYDSKKTGQELVISGRPHKLNENTVTLKTPLKTRNYSLKGIGAFAAFTGRSAFKGVPKLKVVTKEGSKDLTIQLSGSVSW